MSISDRFHCGALIVVTWDDTVPDISIRFGVYREYCCITWSEAGPRRRGGDTLCVPRSDIDVGGSLGRGTRSEYFIHIMTKAAAIRFYRRRTPSTSPSHCQLTGRRGGNFPESLQPTSNETSSRIRTTPPGYRSRDGVVVKASVRYHAQRTGLRRDRGQHCSVGRVFEEGFFGLFLGLSQYVSVKLRSVKKQQNSQVSLFGMVLC